MKKILQILIFIFLGAVVIAYFLLGDNPEDFIPYQTYASQLESFETQYGTMKYYDQGEGSVILLLHGVPTNSWMYRKVSQELVNNGYRVIAPDLMGFGQSDRMSEYDMYDFENQADILLDLMMFLDIEEWEQVTHDMGGLVTWNMVHLAPEKISHLYILNTILYKETFNPPADFSYKNSLHRWVLSLHAHPFIGKIIVNNMMRTGTDNHSFTHSERVGYWLPIRDGAGALVHFFTHTADIKENLATYRSWLVDSGVSVSVIWGENDPFLDSASVELLQDEMSLLDSDVFILKDKKHLVAEESYLEIVNIIVNHE